MAPRVVSADVPPAEPAALLGLALARPQEALDAARSLLASNPDAYAASFAHHAAGIVLRDRGELPASIAELRRAVRLARASGRDERVVDVRATLGVALAWSGRSRDGLALLDDAVATSSGPAGARVLVRRASVRHDLGRFDEARDDLSRALVPFRRARDTVWEARTLMLRADVYVALGLPARAAEDWARAEEVFAASGQDLEYAMSRHNRGQAAVVRGDIPQALTYLDEARRRYDGLGHFNPDLPIDRSRALLAAGLAEEAMHEADTAAAREPSGGGIAYKTAELLLEAATAAMAHGDPGAAMDRARRAQRLFRLHGREVWQLRAGLVVAEARYASGSATAALFATVTALAARLDALGAHDGQPAHLLAGRIALDQGRVGDADEHLDRAARARRAGPSLRRSQGWLAAALQSEAHGLGRRTVLACGRGLDALDEHLMSLGATELRAHATTHGAELARLAQREMLRRDDTRGLLRWSERWRATALTPRGADSVDDPELATDLAALRAVSRMLETDGSSAGRRVALERSRRRLENDVRARSRRVTGDASNRAERFDLTGLVEALGESALVELVEVDGVLHALTVSGGRVRRHAVGPMPHDEVEAARFALRRIAYDLDPGRDSAALAADGRALEAALLGTAGTDLGDGPVVVVPTGRLQAVPWTILPSLSDRVVSVMPSAATWLRARERRLAGATSDGVALVVGPGLRSEGAEVRQLSSRYPGAAMLADGTATVENVLAAMDGARLAHLAAHGRFRSDNPLFSSLQLDDGPLTVHDLERLRRAPLHLVLSSCVSGVSASVGADELLGLVTALVPSGAVGIVASIVAVNDDAVVPLMLALHDALGRGRSTSEALYDARLANAEDPLVSATAHAFVALGV
jgi:tetratricopeptide (TPR) repeat protein